MSDQIWSWILSLVGVIRLPWIKKPENANATPVATARDLAVKDPF